MVFSCKYIPKNTTAKPNISAYKAGETINILIVLKFAVFLNCED